MSLYLLATVDGLLESEAGHTKKVTRLELTLFLRASDLIWITSARL